VERGDDPTERMPRYVLPRSAMDCVRFTSL
jgi:hypothetical protein